MEQTLSREEKLRILKALEEDREFRYAVAGLIGVSDILERLDRIEENLEKLWTEVRNLRESQEKLWLEVKSLREGQERLWENQEKLWIEVKNLRENQEKLWLEVKSLREGQERLWENQEKLWLEVKSLREGQEKLWLEVKSLREGQERLWENQEKLWLEVRDLREVQTSMLEAQRSMSITLERLAVTVDRLTLSVEEEARDVVGHRLKQELGVDMALDRLFIDERELDLYGAAGDLVLIGEAVVRLGVKLLDELEDKIRHIKLKRPELLRPKLVKAVYTDYAPPAALESARRRGIWVLKWSGDLTPRKIHEVKAPR
jgi:hypothetical protein